jgi:large subunit ribosomal protein L13
MGDKIIVNAKGTVLGRMGTYVAKELLKGNSVDVINAEETAMSGNKKDILNKIIAMRKKGGTSLRGPKYPKLADRFVKRKIRGMLPREKTKGREAFKRLKCYIGNPLKEDQMKSVKELKHNVPFKNLKIKEIMKLI